jgi:hypothetical protein
VSGGPDLSAELAERYLHGLAVAPASTWVVVALAYATIALALGLGPRAHRAWFRPAAALVSLAWVAFAAMAAWRARWICDDAFISFRYAANWVHGDGLVYNPGERVEGYTNFLWTLLVAGGTWLRVDPVVTTVVLGFASSAFALAVVWKLCRDLSPSGRSAPLIGVVLLATNDLFAQYTTSGLETMFAAALSLWAVERASHRAYATAGLAGVLATMAHPDHAIAYAVLGLVVALGEGRFTPWPARVRAIARYAAPFALLYVPYFAIRYAYYGALFPNTYYAKSGGAVYFSQGFAYLAISALAAGLLGALPLVIAGALEHRGSVLARYAALLTPSYGLYVAKIGGDFMLGRLVVVLLLPAAVLVDAGARALFRRRGALRVGAAVGLLSAMSLAVNAVVVLPREKYHHVADERTFYELERVASDGVRSELTEMARAFAVAVSAVAHPPVMVTGCIGIFGYLTGLHIVDVYGLTDPHVARQPIARRGRPGHEKWISAAYALESGGDFTDISLLPARYEQQLTFRVGGLPYHLLAHRPERMADLARGANVEMPDIASAVASYHPPEGASELACDLWVWETVFFRHHPGEERAAFVERLVREGALDGALQGFYARPEGEAPPGAEPIRVFTLDAPARDGFGDRPAWSVDRTPLGQLEVGGSRGGFIDSWTQDEGDRATGEMASRPFLLEGDVLELRVGGGMNSRAAVSLEVDDVTVAQATGCNLEVMGRRLWNIAPYRGRAAVLRIVDHTPDSWGHIVVDHITEWRVPGTAR